MDPGVAGRRAGGGGAPKGPLSSSVDALGTSRYKSLTDPVAQDGLEVVVVCSKPGYVQRLTATARQVNDEPPAAIIWMPADGSTRRSGAGSLSRRAVNLRVVPPLVRSGNGADGRTVWDPCRVSKLVQLGTARGRLERSLPCTSVPFFNSHLDVGSLMLHR